MTVFNLKRVSAGVENITNGEPTAVSLGIFDGVHIGHRAVLNSAKQSGLKTAVFTFLSETVTTKGNKGVIYPDEKKLEILKGLNIDYVLSPSFSDFKDMSAEDFVKDILVEAFNAKWVFCGEDFRFGKGAEAGVSRLAELCRKYGVELSVTPPVMYKGQAVSSTRIKNALIRGDISSANDMLYEKFGYFEKVIHGNEIGRTLDFPTINQPIPRKTVLPRFGVYLTEVEVFGQTYRGVSNVGVKPTVGNKEPLIETHILSYSGNLYGEKLSVRLVKFLREEKRFSSLEKLKEQVDRDIQNAGREVL